MSKIFLETRGFRVSLLRSTWPCLFLSSYPHITLLAQPECPFLPAPPSPPHPQIEKLLSPTLRTNAVETFPDPPNGSKPSYPRAPTPVEPSLPHHSSLFIPFPYNEPDSFQSLSTRREQKAVQALASRSWKFAPASSPCPFPWRS